MKDKKGVTLIALVTTIIIILILASIAIYSGASTIRYAKYNKAKSEIQLIQSYVNQWYQEYQEEEDKINFLNQYGEPTSVCNSEELQNTFAGGGINSSNKQDNYRFFSASFLKDKIGIDASFEYLISIPDRNTILYNGIMYNKEPYYTLDDFDVQNIKETANSDIDFALEQGDNTNIVIKDLKIIYTEFKRKEENGEITVVPVKRMNDLSKFIVEYQKVGETNWTDATKDVTNFNDNGNTKFKFSVSEGNYNIRIFSTDKKIQSKEKEIAVIKSKLTPNELAAIATHNQNHPDDIIEELPQNEIPNNLKDPDKIKAVLTGEVPIPDKAEYLEGSKDTGVVIRYKGSEFVWVPVPDAIYDSTNDDKLPKSAETGSLTEGHNYTPMAINIENGTEMEVYKGLLYRYNYDKVLTNGACLLYPDALQYQGTSLQCREPDLITGFGTDYDGDAANYNLVLGYSSAITFETAMQDDYNKMVKSVAKYGGFFLGRYETSYDGTDVASVSGENVYPMTSVTTSGNMWYGMYLKQKNFTKSTDEMQAEMLWGSQYDATLNWILKGTDKAHINAATNGNQQGTSAGAVACGAYGNGSDRMNNIYDLEGNVYEWTQEANGTNVPCVRIGRGGAYSTGGRIPASYFSNFLPTYTLSDLGSRMSLYIK